MKATTRSWIFAVSLALGLGAHASLSAQGLPIDGTASVTLGKIASSLATGQTLPVALLVDLSGVSGAAQGGLRTPAVLGGYQVEVSFDSKVVRFDGVSGGTANGFTTSPVSTNASVANATGKVRIVAAQTSQQSPRGLAQVATLLFTVRGAGSPAISAKPLSLSTAFQGNGAGPTSIPASIPRTRAGKVL